MTASFRQTTLVAVDEARPEEEAISGAARIILQGNLVAFPTETVYGLGSDALNPLALERIFWADGRPANLAGVSTARRRIFKKIRVWSLQNGSTECLRIMKHDDANDEE